MTELNENHKRSLFSGFRRVDDLLSDIERVIETTADPRSPFKKYVLGITPAQQKIIATEIAHIRSEMCRILEKKGIEIDHPRISAVRAVCNAIHFADMAVEEMGPKHMRGYGKLTKEAVGELNEVTAQMQKLLKRIPEVFICRTAT